MKKFFITQANKHNRTRDRNETARNMCNNE
jgi:hypothetical protein